MSELLHPDYPVVEGRYQMTGEWALTLPEKFNRRFEDGCLVLWRPGLTAWIDVWGNDTGETPQQMCRGVRGRANSAAFDAKLIDHGTNVWWSYRLAESWEQGAVPGLYAFAFSKRGRVRIAFYFDQESRLETANQIWLSTTDEPLQ